MDQKNIGIEKALQKIKHFCSYEERSHQEVKEKLYSFGLYTNQVQVLLSQMITENYLNEERYAIAFAGGRFRIKNWGRVKIKYELKQNCVSDYCIKKALDSIEASAYQRIFKKLFDAKLKTLKAEKNIYVKKQKIRSFLIQKGYESKLISDFIHKM